MYNKLYKKDENDKFMKQRSKITFKVIHKSYENCDSYTFKQNEVLMDTQIYLGFAIIELSKLHTYETSYDKIQPFIGIENIQLHYMDCDSFVLIIKTENSIKKFKNLENKCDFSNLDENHELFSNKIKKNYGII